MKILPKTIKNLILIIGLFLVISPQSSLAQNTGKILILPFDVRTDTKYAFLRPAILDMLFTRLSAPGRTLIVDNPAKSSGTTQADPMTIADAIKFARQKSADFVVSGSITLWDESIGMNAYFIGIAEQRALITFSQKGKQAGDIITQIDNFAAKVNADIFGPGKSLDTQPALTETSDVIHQHPEKLVIPETPSDTPPDNLPINQKVSIPERPDLNSL